MPKQIVKKPIISEKGFQDATKGKFTFMVDKNSSKEDVKTSIENQYKVNVVKINSKNIRGKHKNIKGFSGVRSDKKITIVTLKENQKIDLFEIEKEKQSQDSKKNKTKKEKTKVKDGN